MRKIITLLTALFILNGAFASVTVINPPLKASEIFFQIGNTGQIISLLDLSLIKVKDFETLTGKKMKFADRLTFKVSQNQLRQSINADGTFNKKKVEKFFTKKVDGKGGSSLGGFALGFFLGLLGVIIAYIAKDDKRRNRVKWAWIGFAALVALVIIIYSSGAWYV